MTSRANVLACNEPININVKKLAGHMSTSVPNQSIYKVVWNEAIHKKFSLKQIKLLLWYKVT